MTPIGEHPKDISISDYHYDLPPGRIASEPLTERDSSKLLVYHEGRIRETSFHQLAAELPGDSLLVFNDTKVVEARILFFKPSGAQVEIFCLEPPIEYGSIAEAMQQKGVVRWKCLIGGASKWKPGQVLRREIPMPSPENEKRGAENPPLQNGWVEARWVDKLEDSFLIELSWSPVDWTFAEMLHHGGSIPLPPYIRRPPTDRDRERYQTVFAHYEGSVAAPTAGLHFTPALIEGLKAVDKDFVTLHVGAGTFMPVKAPRLSEHSMHVEWIGVRRDTIEKLETLASSKIIIPVGTTSLRTIESLYWLGLLTIRRPGIKPEELIVSQWEPYEQAISDQVGTGEALRALMVWMDRQGLRTLFARTQLLIAPGYPWKLTGALITNFHQPESTLLLLVAALVGPSWKNIYGYALAHDFRFLSYGDGSLLFRSDGSR